MEQQISREMDFFMYLIEAYAAHKNRPTGDVLKEWDRLGLTDLIYAMYEKYHEQGLEILDFPCNQFGQQAPESEEEYHSFCQLNYKTKFPQFAKTDVNGEKELPLFKWLKSKKGFAGFDPNHKLTPILNDLLGKADPDFAKKPDIKWNFTKFLVDKQGHVVERFEPTADKTVIAPAIEAELKK